MQNTAVNTLEAPSENGAAQGFELILQRQGLRLPRGDAARQRGKGLRQRLRGQGQVEALHGIFGSDGQPSLIQQALAATFFDALPASATP